MENFIYLVLNLALNGFATALGTKDGEDFKDYYERLFIRSPNIKKWFMEKI